MFDQSMLICRRFKNRLKSLWIYDPPCGGGITGVWGKTQRRFDIQKSNSKFKHDFVKAGNSPALLKTLKRVRCQPLVGARDLSHGQYLRTGGIRSCGWGVWAHERREKKKVGSSARNRGVKGPRSSAANPAAQGPGPWKARNFMSNPSIHSAKRVIVKKDGNYAVPGGLAVPFGPAMGHLKYWYFLRRRGFWSPSEHHPHRDDAEIYKFTQVDGADEAQQVSDLR